MQDFSVNKQRKKQKNASSKFVGVYFNKVRKKWVAQIELNGQCQVLGAFDCEIQAAAAYQDKLRELILAGKAINTPVFIEDFKNRFLIIEANFS
jgi:hypothetical protein